MRAHHSPQSNLPYPEIPLAVVWPRPADEPRTALENAPEGGGSSLLVNTSQFMPRRAQGKKRRHYWMLMTILYRMEAMNLSILRLDLTTAVGGDAGLLAEHFIVLRKRIERRIGKSLHFWAMQTAEGNGVIHSVIAAEGSLYVDQEWLSGQWEDIHGAPVVYVKRYQKGRASRGKVSHYMVGQYMKNQDAVVRVSASWKRTFGFPVAAAWRNLKREYQGEKFKALLEAWHEILSEAGS